LGRIEKSIEIKASPEKVWEMLALDRWSEWQVVGGIGSLQIEKGVKFTSEVNAPEDKYRLGASARPTKLTYAVSYEMPWGIFGKFIEKLFAKRMGEGQLKKSLEKLKSILEK
jgi:uncharacterized membrane protein